MRSEKTRYIDIIKLESESRKLFFFGYIIGITFIASLHPLFAYKHELSSHFSISNRNIKKHIMIDLVTITPPKEIPETPVIIPKTNESPEPSQEQIIDTPPETADAPVLEKNETSVLFSQSAPDTFPNLSGRNSIPQQHVSKPETLRMPEEWQIFPEPEPDPVIKTPVEKVDDERREFKTDLFGIPFGGIPAIPLHIVRNTPGFIVWKFRDIKRNRAAKKMSKQNFVSLSEKDMRFLILVWRDGICDTRKLSKQDREFINTAQNSENAIITHNDYLSDMEKRGIVSSLELNDHLVFRAVFPRDEVLYALNNEKAKNTGTETTDSLDKLIKLITTYADSVTTEIVLPTRQ